MSRSRAAPDNPCQKEQDNSYKCLNDNHYDKDKCELYFANYTNCAKFWTNIRNERRRKGISPELPLLEDREKIKADYFKTKPT